MAEGHILLVDDSASFLIALRDLLAAAGLEVTTASSAEEALAALRTVRPDLIILDIGMPGMGGLGFLKAISTPGGHRLQYPVLVLTARVLMESFIESLPVEGFMAKPCSETALLRRIKEILALHPPRAASGHAPKRVLIGQDEREIASEWLHALKAAGYDVLLAENATQVLASVVSFQPQAVVLNEVFPGMNGGTLAQVLRAMPAVRGAAIVVCDWTHTPPDDEQRVLHEREGVDRLLTIGTAQGVLEALDDLLGRSVSPPEQGGETPRER